MATAINLPADKFDTDMTFVRPSPAPTRVALDKLAVLPGFNTRVKDADYQERVLGISESIVANGFFDDKPFAVTMLPNDDTVYIYDGEHRFDAAKAAVLDGAEFPDGLPVAWAKDGATVRDLTIHLAHGNAGERLNMVEMAAVVRRLQGLGMGKDEIATALGRTTRHVDNLFVLAGANQTVKKAVASGQIAGAEAVKLLRKDPKTAAAKITEAVKKAAEKGKAKATPKTMGESKPTGPKMKTIAIEQSMPEGETMGAVLKLLATQIREHVQIGDGDKLAETGMIRVKLEVIDHEAEAEKARREAERKEAAEKREAEKAERQRQKDADAAQKKAAQDAMLKEAASGGKKTQKVEKPGKTASGGKTQKTAEKPASGKKAATATPAAEKAESVADGADSAAPADATPSDEGMNGL